MKKLIFILTVLFIILLPVFSEDGKGMKQYQTFSWEPVANAKKYEVSVQRKTGKDTWENAASEKTADCHVEMLLDPGNYRVQISAFNVLGKKASSSPQQPFVILDETEPYLFDGIFEQDAQRNTPVFHIPSALGGSPVYEITLKGKNIYFPDTQFVLMPADTGASDAAEFPSYTAGRKPVPLTVVRRDREKDSVVVSYDPAALFTGYYALTVINPGDNKTDCSVLVFAGRVPVIAKESFAYSKRYTVQTVSLERSSEARLTVRGSDFQYDTKFTLEPSEGIPYPFATAKNRQPVPLTVTDYMDGLALSYDPDAVETGYYALTVQTPGLETVTEQLLVTVPVLSTKLPDINKIRSKYNKKEQTVRLSAAGKNLNEVVSAVLVSSYSKQSGLNTRIPVDIKKTDTNGKQSTFLMASASLSAGTWILLLETEKDPVSEYVVIDKKNRIKLCTMDSAQSDELFLRPENPEEQEEEPSKQTKTVKKKLDPVFLPFAGIRVAMNQEQFNYLYKADSGVDLKKLTYGAEVRIIDHGWYSLDAAVQYNGYSEHWGADLSVRVAIPWTYFKPYAGIGFGSTFDGLTKKELYIPIYCGLTLFRYIDFRYASILWNPDTAKDADTERRMSNPKYMMDTVSVGILFRIRPARVVMMEKKQK